MVYERQNVLFGFKSLRSLPEGGKVVFEVNLLREWF
jgi:hypothetical protein